MEFCVRNVPICKMQIVFLNIFLFFHLSEDLRRSHILNVCLVGHLAFTVLISWRGVWGEGS